MRILGAIIAGGQSSRMGGVEKAFIKLGGKPIIQHIVECLRVQTSEIVINANGDAGRFESLNCVVVPDGLGAGETPLAGLAAVLAYAELSDFDAVISVPSDTPFLPDDLVERLNGGSAAIASSKGQDHFLTGFWPASLTGMLMKAIVEADLLRMQEWVKMIGARKVEWSSLGFDPFFNINTPDDLKKAEDWCRREV